MPTHTAQKHTSESDEGITEAIISPHRGGGTKGHDVMSPDGGALRSDENHESKVELEHGKLSVSSVMIVDPKHQIRDAVGSEKAQAGDNMFQDVVRRPVCNAGSGILATSSPVVATTNLLGSIRGFLGDAKRNRCGSKVGRSVEELRWGRAIIDHGRKYSCEAPFRGGGKGPAFRPMAHSSKTSLSMRPACLSGLRVGATS